MFFTAVGAPLQPVPNKFRGRVVPWKSTRQTPNKYHYACYISSCNLFLTVSVLNFEPKDLLLEMVVLCVCISIYAVMILVKVTSD